MKDISVIVPVYNVQEYIESCISSIRMQTYKDWEMIMIDDGSTDKSGSICDYYASIDERIRVIHQENRGVSSARNVGMREASGNYIFFIDPDDYVDLDMFAKMRLAESEKIYDIVICGMIDCTEEGNIIKDLPVTEGEYTRKQLIESLYGMPNPFHGSMCNKMFRRELLKGLSFDETCAIGEDWLMLYQCYQQVQLAKCLPQSFYYIRNRKNSATRQYTASIYVSKFNTYATLYEYSKRHEKDMQCKAVNKILDAGIANILAIIEYDNNRDCISEIAQKLLSIIIEATFSGLLSWKRAAAYFVRGLYYYL